LKQFKRNTYEGGNNIKRQYAEIKV
jgi:hypothetical protein